MNSSERPTLEQLEREHRRLLRNKRRSRALRRALGITLVVLALGILVSSLLLPVLLVQGSSMEPTLREGQAVICLRGSRFERGDIVAFSYGDRILIKRVIAGEGDTVDMDEAGHVYLNGELLREDYVREQAVGNLSMALPCTVPEDCWFLMGDQRSVSVDSRSSLVGFVSTEQILGRVQLRVWPLWYLGKIES